MLFDAAPLPVIAEEQQQDSDLLTAYYSEPKQLDITLPEYTLAEDEFTVSPVEDMQSLISAVNKPLLKKRGLLKAADRNTAEQNQQADAAPASITGYAAFEIKLAEGAHKAESYSVPVSFDAPIDVFADNPEENASIVGVSCTLYHFQEDGSYTVVKDAQVNWADNLLTGFTFTTEGFSAFLLKYTVEYIVINNSGVVSLDFTDYAPYPAEGAESVFVYDTARCDVRVTLEAVLAAGQASAADGVAAEGVTENFEIDLTNLTVASAESGVSYDEASGGLIIAADGSITLSDGTKTLTVNVTGITRLSEEILTAEGVQIKVAEGNVPLGSQALYTAHSDEETAALVEQFKLGEGSEGIEGYSSADLRIVLDQQEISAEGRFQVTLDKASLIPEHMKLDKLYHIHGENVEELAVTETEDGLLAFEVASFSDIVASYTVDFYYEDYEYHLPGGNVMTLSALFAALEIDRDAADVTAVTFSNPELLQVEKVESDTTLGAFITALGLEMELTEEEAAAALSAGDWALISLQPFDTTESLTIDFADGDQIVVRVEDATQYQATFNVNDTNGGRIFDQKEHRYSISISFSFSEASDHLVESQVKPVRDQDYSRSANNGWHFVKWVESGINDYSTSTDYIKPVDPGHAQTYTACFAPDNQYLILYTWNPENGDVSGGDARHFEYIYPQDPYTQTAWQYFSYSGDESGMVASPHAGYFFKGWYNLANGELVCTDFAFNGSQVTSDMTVFPWFEHIYWYRAMVNDGSMGYLTQTGNGAFNSTPQNPSVYTGSNTNFSHIAIVAKAGGYCSIYNNTYPNVSGSNEFRYWVKDDGTYPNVLHSDNNCLRGSGGHDDKNLLDRDGTTFVAFFAPAGEKIVRLNFAQPAGSGETSMMSGSALRTLDVDNDGRAEFYYLYTNDQSGIQVSQTTEQAEKYTFKGWYNEDGRLISSEYSLQINKDTLPSDKNDFVLTPVFEEKPKERDYFIVCYDGSNGLNGGDPANNTLYSRLESSGRIQGSTTVSAEVAKIGQGENAYADITLPTAAEVAAPQSVGANHFALQGWYDINTKQYYQPGASVRITDDSVFYADWFPDNYSFANSADSVSSVNTNSFISTYLYDFNNLFNMESIEPDPDRSYIQTDENETDVSKKHKNFDYWKMKDGSRDFLFISTVSGFGRSLNPAGRTWANQNHEVSTSDAEFAGTVTAGLFGSSPFAQSSTLGMRSLGSANYLYQYDSDTGYYYYDSDKNAASFNQSAGRFYVYSYRNGTNKSNGGYDFLPLNYGNTIFNEAYGAPNYWFGMTSSINFFLPNATGTTDNQGNYGNRSTVRDEMVYKFSGDDDVWVFVDGKPVLDMGGIHGKVYGEINFSQGTWTIAQSGASKTTDSRGIMSYGSGGTVTNGTINLSEGDHTLTLYYLERGSSQSNCAIYFNLAPRYSLQFRKQGENSDSMANVKFGIYTDAACTRAASLKSLYGSTVGNEFATGSDGIVHCTGLAAGHTYYIKELEAPAGYPDVSSEVIKLTIDTDGTPHVESTADESGENGWKMASVTSSEKDDDPNNNGIFMFYLIVKNKKVTSVTARKTWSLLDGKDYITFDGNSIVQDTSAWSAVKLQRYYEDTNGMAVANHSVYLVSQYFANGDKPSARDDKTIVVYKSEKRSVEDNGAISFQISTGTGAAIYSVVASNGSISRTYGNYSTDNPFYVNGSPANMPMSADISVSNIRTDTVIYITIIGEASSGADLDGKVSITNVSTTSNGSPRRITQDTAFNNIQSSFRLDSNNDWKHTWDNLDSSDGNGRNYYYYVIETGSSTPQSSTIVGAAFIQTASSDGLSAGVITVHNTLKAIKVKLRKKDAVKRDGYTVPLEGGEFYIYTEAEYQNLIGNQTATAITPEPALISSGEMGTPSGTKLTADSLGRFYTGFLPMGTYYIVEENAPDGYQKLTNPIKIVVSETGLSCDMQGGNNLKHKNPDSDGIYNLYIDNTLGNGSIQLQKIWESQDTTQTLTRAHAGNNKTFTYSTSDNGSTAVLLSLTAVVNGAVDNSVLSDVYENPTAHSLSAGSIVTRDNNQYIKLSKQNDGTWPVLTINNLPLKKQVSVQITENGVSKTREQMADIWYYVEEIGVYDSAGTLLNYSQSLDHWTVAYGYMNGASNGTGKTETVSGTSRNLIKAKASAPDTLTVTNGMKGQLSFTKQDTEGHPLQGAEFKIIPDGAGEGNFITGIGTNGVLTSGSNGTVTIPALPIGTYWLLETKAPAGYMLNQTRYRIEIRYGAGASKLYAADGATEINVIPNTPGVELPATGGPGTAVYTVSGLSVMAAALWLIMRRRRAD